VHIVLCAYHPNIDHFQRQISSIIEQTHRLWTCEIRVDGCGPELSEIESLIGRDSRFALVINPERLGVFHNFEAGIANAPECAQLIALCDQDDEWLPEKLEVMIRAFDDPNVVLAHSDLSVIDAAGNIMFPSCFSAEKRVIDDYSLAQLIIRNSVSGCTCLFRQSLRTYLLPFPQQNLTIAFHHDLWIALIATQCGKIETINRPLVRYRQHGGNVVGVETAAGRKNRAPLNLKARSWVANWTLRNQLIHEILSRPAGNDSLSTARERAEVEGWLNAWPINLRLTFRAVRLIARGYPAGGVALDTALGKLVVFCLPFLRATRRYVQAQKDRLQRLRLIWQAARRFIFQRDFRARVYDALSRQQPPVPGQMLSSADSSSENDPDHADQYSARIPFVFTALSPRVTMVVPTGRVEHIYGGLATAFKLGVALAEQGLPVRFVSTEHYLSENDIADLRRFLAERCNFNSDPSLIEIRSASEKSLPAHRDDIFIATIWWTARRISQTLEEGAFSFSEFYYLIQDFEPNFYPWSDEFALAASTYRMRCKPIVNTRFLADFLLKETGLKTLPSYVFSPEIEWHYFQPPTVDEIASRKVRRIFFYGRPGNPRNLFLVGCSALRRFISELALGPSDVEVISAGEKHDPINLGNAVFLRSVGKLSMADYAKTLREADIGISLMLSPHPSYPPFEMAASGLMVVTNNFGTKYMDFSENFLTPEASPEEIAQALKQAWFRSADGAARRRGATMDVSSLGRPLRDVGIALASEIKDHFELVNSTDSQTLKRCDSVGIFYRVNSQRDIDFTDQRVCLFSHFDVDNRVDEHVINYLSAIKAEGFKIVFVTSNLELVRGDLTSVEALCSAIVHRENKGYDFAGWALAMRVFPSIQNAKEVLVTNDSVYGPLRPLRPIFAMMDNRTCDFWGITESHEVEWHLQSYFLVFKKSAIKSPAYREFWAGVVALNEKQQVIERYELSLARSLSEGGLLEPASLVSLSFTTKSICNPTLKLWKEIIVESNSPFIKVQLLRDNPLDCKIEGWDKIVGEMNYDPQMIRNHLLRMRRKGSPH
jgi:hypothetical protein